MGKTRDVLGHVSVEVAGKKRVCHRDRSHAIHGGEPCLAILGGPRNARKNYCRVCARAILDCARGRLADIEQNLFHEPSDSGPL